MAPPDPLAEAQALQASGRFAEAADAYRAVPPPQMTVRAAIGFAGCLVRTGAAAEAQPWLQVAQRSAARSADVGRALVGLGFELLADGFYAEGWPLLDHRVGLDDDLIPRIAPSYPEWRGEPLAGRSILVWVEQGFGDQIMLARFAAVLAEQGAAVTLACHPPLARLFATLPGVRTVLPVPVGGGVDVPRHDLWTRYFSLPARLGTTLASLPATPYLAAPAGPAPDVGAARFGLVWRTSATGALATAKTLPAALAHDLAALGGFSLHPEDTGAADFADTAAAIARLPLVITVDTAVAHLAGAMGKPVWVLLAHDADWRWLKDRSDSPWYPSARLFRQPAPGDWASVVPDVRLALKTG